jgi:hypothetical protein
MVQSGDSSLTTSTGDTKSFDASKCVPRGKFSPHIGDSPQSRDDNMVLTIFMIG